MECELCLGVIGKIFKNKYNIIEMQIQKYNYVDGDRGIFEYIDTYVNQTLNAYKSFHSLSSICLYSYIIQLPIKSFIKQFS